MSGFFIFTNVGISIKLCIFVGMRIFSRSKKQRFQSICQANEIRLDYNENKSEFAVFSEIFEQRSYADYFPFYQTATIVDVGAHFGYFSLFAHSNTKKDSNIIAIEVDQRNAKQLEANMIKNEVPNVKIMNCGIGKESGETQLYKGATVNHSILKNYALAYLESESEIVEMKTLEQIMEENALAQIDFLKLDCEGAEYQILESLPTRIFQQIKVISMEFHDLKDEKHNGDFLRTLLLSHDFSIEKYEYSPTSMGMNYGKLIGMNQKNAVQ